MTSDKPRTPSSRPVYPEHSEHVQARIFFDTDVLYGQSEAQKELQRRKLRFLYFGNKKIELITTEFTRIQVAKNRAEKAYDELKILSNERALKLANDIFSLDIPTIDKKRMYEAAYNHFLEKITEETSGTNWRCVESRDGVVSKVFMEYGNKRGFFRDGAKKGQFADAIVFEMIRPEATRETPLIIFARDKDFSAVDEYDDNIKHVKSWSALIDAIGIREDISQAECLVKKYQPFVVEKVHGHLWEVWNEAMDTRGQVRDVIPEIVVRRVESHAKGGVIFEDSPPGKMALVEHFMIIGEMQVFFDLPRDMPVFLAPYWSTVDGDATSEPRERADARCDVVFTIIGRLAGSQDNVDWLEIEFGDGSVHYFADIEL